MKIYCPNCNDIYTPNTPTSMNLVIFLRIDIDGAYIGTTFANLFFMTYPHHLVKEPIPTYTPTVFGFKIHSSSDYNQIKPKTKKKIS